ncbi:MAG: phosphoribosylaminoimidazolecarboxamide formyltransferase [Clostridia bacterium]|nr:phosphoribosylaminoimidazolecarboxamide formyltransferase [Clostridia bacterium]
MREFKLKYGVNPNQKDAKLLMKDGSDLPFEIINGRPGYINFLDALNSWQLVKELKEATGLAAAASFKHVSPTSAAVAMPMSEELKRACFVDHLNFEDSDIALAYARARGTDRLCSYGDFIALSDICDKSCALMIKGEVSDGVIAPGFTDEALEILRAKKKGNYNVIKIDASYVPLEIEEKQVFGVTFSQSRNNVKIDEKALENVVSKEKDIPDSAKVDLILGEIVLKYTQSNSVCFVKDGQAIGVGAGQQSRIHCTRLAAGKADTWHLRQMDKVLNLPFKAELKRAERDNVVDGYINRNEEDVVENWEKYFTSKPDPLTEEEKRKYLDTVKGVTLASDAFFPFDDSIKRGYMSGVKYVIEPGGSIRDEDVIRKADEYGMVLIFNGIRLFHH